MKPLPKSLLIRAKVWRWLTPLRWLVCTNLWILSKVLQVLAWIPYGLHVAIDYVRIQLDFTARPDDVFIVTYPRSGTTWLQMIMYQLTTDGNMDFDHIADKCPWFERAALNKRNFQALPSPRVFKSHLPYIWIPKRACRYIYMVRDGRDVAVSFYHFYKSHFRYKGSLSDFFKLYMLGLVAWGSWFYHVARWWRHRDDPNVLFLKYEDLVRDLEGGIRRIIEFCELSIPEERIPEIVRRSGFAFMKQHEAKFDFAMELLLEQGITPGQFVREGKTGGWQERLTADEINRFGRKSRSVGKLGLTYGANEAVALAEAVLPGEPQ